MYRMLKITPEELIEAKKNYKYIECYCCEKMIIDYDKCDCCDHIFCEKCEQLRDNFQDNYQHNNNIIFPDDSKYGNFYCPCKFYDKCISSFKMREILNNPFNITINAGIEEILNEYDESLKKENNIIEI